MRKTFVSFSFVCLSSALGMGLAHAQVPGKSPVNTEQTLRCTAKTTADSVAVVKRWLDGLTSGQAEALVQELWSEDSLVIVPTALPYGGEITRDGQTAYGTAVATTWDTSELGQPNLYGNCNKVFVDARWTATVRATGIRVDQPLLEVFEVQSGKIVRDTLYFFDTKQLVDAINGVQSAHK